MIYTIFYVGNSVDKALAWDFAKILSYRQHQNITICICNTASCSAKIESFIPIYLVLGPTAEI